MLTHPLQCGDQVEHPGIAGLGEALAARLRQIEMAEDVQAMVDGYDHDIVASCEPRAVIAWRVGRAVRERAAMQPDHHRAPCIVQSGRPDMQRQAVLADRQGIDRSPHGRKLRALLGGRRLRRATGIGDRLAYAGPRLGLARRHEAVGPGRRRAVGDALEDMHAVRRHTSDATGCGLDDGRAGSLVGALRQSIDITGHGAFSHSVDRSLRVPLQSVNDLLPPHRATRWGGGREAAGGVMGDSNVEASDPTVAV